MYLSSLLKTILKQSADCRTDFHDCGVEVSIKVGTDVLIDFIMFSFAAKTFCPNFCALTGQNWFLNLFVSYHYYIKMSKKGTFLKPNFAQFGRNSKLQDSYFYLHNSL